MGAHPPGGGILLCFTPPHTHTPSSCHLPLYFCLFICPLPFLPPLPPALPDFFCLLHFLTHTTLLPILLPSTCHLPTFCLCACMPVCSLVHYIAFYVYACMPVYTIPTFHTCCVHAIYTFFMHFYLLFCTHTLHFALYLYMPTCGLVCLPTHLPACHLPFACLLPLHLHADGLLNDIT